MFVSLLAPIFIFVVAVTSPTAGVTVSGQISGLDGNDHVVVKLEGPRTYRATSRWAGHWQVEQVQAGSYFVTPYHQRYTFEPARLEVGVENVRKLSFTARRKEKKP